MRSYTDYNVGERIELYCTNDKFSSVPTLKTIWATVIGKNNGNGYTSAVNYPLIGWSGNEKILTENKWDIFQSDGTFSPQIDTAKDLIVSIKTYCYGWFIYPSEALIIGTEPVTLVIGPDGLMCGWCGDFYPMAASNQTDGSLKCYSCRSTSKITKLY